MFVAGMTAFSSAHAQSFFYDVAKFDVAGVKLGMSYQQAKATLAGYLGVKRRLTKGNNTFDLYTRDEYCGSVG
jgi:outer membrane receptor for ferric coprogen and ferric-rhodotorulic acid